ncbi:MAG TPA: zinc ribbon domain-containing protein [Candidatus Deferrimicrobium sp.]|nr:zinc ribbon domain-containing protein [Candidatus Deferrimicrobium sp.]
MARYDLCPNCEAEMPAGNVHCFACGADIPPPRLDSGSILVQLYPAVTQAMAFEFYRVEAARLAAAGWYPVAHSWGDERTSAGFAAGRAGSSRSRPTRTAASGWSSCCRSAA